MFPQRRGAWLFGALATLLVFVALVETGSGNFNPVRRQRSTDSKIFYGNDAKKNEFPFVVYLKNSVYGQYCSGSLVDRRWVLTSGNCLFDSILNQTTVVLGDYNYSEDDGTEQEISVSEGIFHPEFDEETFDNDIALLRLSKPANIRSEAVAKISTLKSKSFMKKMLANEKSCWVLGWGLVNSDVGSMGAERLQKLRVRFLNDTETYERYEWLFFDTDEDVIPIGAMVTEKVFPDKCKLGGTCDYDGGGPLVCKQKGKWVLTGITSFGFEVDACMTGAKGQVNVQLYDSFIQSVLTQN